MKALIIVDMQNDFMDTGTLPVKGALAIIPAINNLLGAGFDLVVATQDWHPLDHSQLQPNGGQWPVHCIQESHGADIVEEVWKALPEDVVNIYKGDVKDQDGYSGFEGHGAVADLNTILKQNGITDVLVCGVATDYCVRATALDAIRHGFKTTVVLDAIAGVAKDTTEAALAELEAAGVTLV